MFVVALILLAAQEPAQDRIRVARDGNKLQVTVDGEPLATINFKDVARPFIYPLYAPGGVQILRNYPMVEGVEGESSDHPHHTGVWFGHGDINGADVWHREGKIVPVKRLHGPFDVVLVPGGGVVLALDLLDELGEKIGKCSQYFKFKELADGTRIIEISVTLEPLSGEALKFGDTKEGMMGVRTHPNLRLDRPTGHVLNSEGVDDKSVWGMRAKWIDYWGEIDGETVGIAMFDHPDNPRHPTWWHAREYGLFAANPFGISAFEGKPAGAGDMELEVDEEIKFRYRILLHTGTAQSAGIEQHYRNWKDGK